MIFPLFRHNPGHEIIASLYGTIVAQARAGTFYRDYGVPDTANGRLEMIILHIVLFLGRLEGEPPATRALGQALFDHFCRDMDASMREMGVGDLAVPRKMRRIGDAFYGRQAACRAALTAADDAPLVAMLQRHMFADPSNRGTPGRLATYIRATVRQLAEQENEALGRGRVSFPDPNAVQA